MSHTIQSALVFPLVFGFLVLILSIGPILYSHTAELAMTSSLAIEETNEKETIFSTDCVSYQESELEVESGCPEKLYRLIAAISDNINIVFA
ncbi:MAG TPA: hypothetical protein PKV44_01965 [Bacillota bacterium]|nr:hypothetical protein [Bacillota bacterium]HPE39448.1 hypothetical protein [Bacillota bacterium]